MDFRLEQGFIWCEIWSLTLFCVLVPWIWGILTQFPQLAPILKYTKTGLGLTQPTDGLYTWIRLCLVWDVEFYTLGDFLCIAADDLDYLGLIFLTCPNSQNRYEFTLRWLLNLSKALFDVKYGVYHFGWHAHDLGFSIPTSLICPNVLKLDTW